MTNHPKGRHVLAAAVRTGARTILTFNLKDFPVAAVTPWNVEAQSPDDFLVHQYHLDPNEVIQKLEEQAEPLGGIARLLEIQERTVPQFIGLIRELLIATSHNDVYERTGEGRTGTISGFCLSLAP